MGHVFTSGADRSNLPWRIEQNGINVVPEAARVGRVRDLFWIWFAANIGILAVVYGGIVLGFGLDFTQSLLVIVLGTVISFLLVGAFSVAGRDAGAPMMALSRRVFGIYGNLPANFVSWLSLVGWETFTVVTGTLATMAVLGNVLHVGTVPLGLLSMAAVAGLSIAFGLLGQATLVVVQRWASYLLGLLTLVVAAELLPGTPWRQLLSLPSGPWLTGALPAFSIVVAATGLSWSNTAADYSRYVSRAARGRSVIWATVAGSSLPLVALMLLGVLIAARDPKFATAANPLDAIQQALPSWMAVPYLLTAIGGMVVQADLGLYSSGLNLLSMFLPLKRSKSVMVDAVVMLGGTIYIVLVAQSFLGPFESFLLLLGVGIAAWAGVFLAGQLWPHCGAAIGAPSLAGPSVSEDSQLYRGVNFPAVVGWAVGLLAGLLCTTSPFFNGPLAVGVFAGSSLELLVAFVFSGGVCLALGTVRGRRQQAAAASQEATAPRHAGIQLSVDQE